MVLIGTENPQQPHLLTYPRMSPSSQGTDRFIKGLPDGGLKQHSVLNVQTSTTDLLQDTLLQTVMVSPPSKHSARLSALQSWLFQSKTVTVISTYKKSSATEAHFFGFIYLSLTLKYYEASRFYLLLAILFLFNQTALLKKNHTHTKKTASVKTIFPNSTGN